MRVLAALLVALATPVVAAPQRVASLNLCSDEYVLLLAAPGQLVSVSRLGADAQESALAARAAGLHRNRGRITDVVALTPDLVLTSSGDPNAGASARRLGITVVELPQPQTLEDVRANIRRAGAALDRGAAAEAAVGAFDAALGPLSAGPVPTLLVSGGGLTIAPDGLAARYLRHAGLAQQNVPRGSISLERLLADPPAVLVTGDYHPGQMSLNQSWLAHPALAALPGRVRRLHTDGRVWTCLGPSLAPEIARLRKAVAR